MWLDADEEVLNPANISKHIEVEKDLSWVQITHSGTVDEVEHTVPVLPLWTPGASEQAGEEMSRFQLLSVESLSTGSAL